MSRFRFESLFVDDALDRDNELEFEMEQEDTYCVFLPREEVVRLRDHLNAVLGVAP